MGGEMRGGLSAFCMVMNLGLASSPALAGDAVIGIFGDVHGDQETIRRVLEQMNEWHVTHVIGMGDFIRRGGPASLHQILSHITPLTNVPRERIYLVPGNWEHKTGHDPAMMNSILTQYGNLVYDDYDSFGFIQLGDEKIMVSHFPQFMVPEAFLPPPAFRRRLRGQAFVMDTIERGAYPPADVAFVIFAHTHGGGLFRDPISRKIVVNPGVLDAHAKSKDEPTAFTIYNQQAHTLEFLDAINGTVLQSFKLEEGDTIRPDCPLLLRVER